MATSEIVKGLFEGKAPHLKLIYDHLIAELKEFGAFHEVPKRVSIQLKKTSAFAEVQFRKNHLNLEFRIDYNLDDPRVVQQLQLSAHRYVPLVKLEKESDIDSQLLKWLKDAYDLCK